ncbi:MAG TPA: hypothetical protein VK760_09365 [Candidatus Acidoferrales bacterium]|jgi:hypothetical protein|nr:hypothetical protein [Candidatus Acidoferrales bacterium]
MQHDAAALAQRLFEPSRPHEAPVVETLVRFGSGALSYALASRIRIALLRAGEVYLDASPALARLGIDVDAWPAPPAGLFVVEERALYLRSRGPMTVAHEFGHALDCALGGGVYRSGVDPRVRTLFSKAKAFVTPYAATGLDEYFAESLRAYVEANDAASPWPRATRERLRRIDPEMHDYVDVIFRVEFRAAA